ncbi:MAG: hypothetical protein HYS17_02665 [Micavibrio aeruginosavorus]|uniref:Uncharacterized protein n=1 Tax=Micavibrio aeruginosavorus TaxID=349221 RepID=A0A7T5R357_9BACT|nr:MAG: hypothetical protein HYS17_02665 [Micavibrio aeruginosavorus]
MDAIVVVLLVLIIYFLWKIYNQREEEKNELKAIEYQNQKEAELRDKYPHLVGKLEKSWLDVFDRNAERGVSLLQVSFMLFLQESTKIDLSDGSLKWDNLWGLTEELLEHLEKFHKGSTIEHEIAVAHYWQKAAEAVGSLIEENPEIEGAKLEVEPFTNICDIVSFFPKKDNHPDRELSFFDEKGSFPRESEGSAYIKERLKNLGL